MKKRLYQLYNYFYKRNLIKNFKNCRIEDCSGIDSTCKLGEYVVLFRGVYLHDVTIGKFTYIQKNTTAVNCEIGNFCSIANDVTIGLASHPTSMVSTHPVFFDDSQPLPKFFISGKRYANTLPVTRIGSDVWIGQGVMIKAGITIGHGAVLGAGSVVVKDVPPYAIVGGIPAKVIRYRFMPDICLGLLESKWWDLPDDELSKFADIFENPEAFLNIYKGEK